jgi:AraC-like DNA-binding protein
MRRAKNEILTEQHFRSYRPQQLRDVVDAIWDWDIADSKAAQALTILQAPSTPLLLMAPYRAPIDLWQGEFVLPPKCATQIRNTPVTLRPTGPLGMIVVSLRPDAAWRVVGSPLGDFANANISLPDLFGEDEAEMCSELLAGARTSAGRVDTVVAFLLRCLRPPADSIASRAAAHLRRNPTTQMSALATTLNISPRHLGRTFRLAFGMSPKYFARLARIERIIRQRQRGLAWAEIAYACGMADQAHLIREFGALVGERPTDFFAKSSSFTKSSSRESVLPLHGHFIVRPMNGESENFNSLSYRPDRRTPLSDVKRRYGLP